MKSDKQCPSYVPSLARATLQILADCESTHTTVKNLFPAQEGIYWRFNASLEEDGGLKPLIGLDDYRGMEKLAATTKEYLTQCPKDISQCAARLKEINAAAKGVGREGTVSRYDTGTRVEPKSDDEIGWAACRASGLSFGELEGATTTTLTGVLH